MRYLIVGATATGKDTVAQILAKKGLTQLKSYTDRPQRKGEADTHIFVATEDLPTQNVIAKTKIGPYTYLATKEQFDTSDVYVIDPKGVEDLDKVLLKGSLDLIYVIAPLGVRYKRWEKRDPKPTAQTDFQQRVEAEFKEFELFEKKVNPDTNGHRPYNCVQNVYLLNNDEEMTLDALEEVVDEIISDE